MSLGGILRALCAPAYSRVAMTSDKEFGNDDLRTVLEIRVRCGQDREPLAALSH